MTTGELLLCGVKMLFLLIALLIAGVLIECAANWINDQIEDGAAERWKEWRIKRKYRRLAKKRRKTKWEH